MTDDTKALATEATSSRARATPPWAEEAPTALLVLADGTVIEGNGAGATGAISLDHGAVGENQQRGRRLLGPRRRRACARGSGLRGQSFGVVGHWRKRWASVLAAFGPLWSV